MSKWNVAIYLRLSSDDGDKMESNSITNQKSFINLFLKKEKDLKNYDYYIDDGFTGTDFNRPDFQRLLNDMKNGKINTIIVKDLSRFGRNYIEVGNYIEQIFPLYNIRFIAINDNIDSYKDPKSVNNIIVPFKNLMNDEYARDISNKVRSVLNTKRLNGEFTGVSAPYGYLKDPKNKHKFIIDKNASIVVKKIFNMILNGKSKKEVIVELNNNGILPPAVYKQNENIAKYKKTSLNKIWNTKMLDRILQNQAYTGDLVQGKRRRISHKIHNLVRLNTDDWIIVQEHHEAIINKQDFEQVQNIIYSRDMRVNKNKEYDIFSGYLKCGSCGNTMTVRKFKSYEYFYCTSYIKQKSCSKHSIKKKELEDIVLKIINMQIELLIDIDEKLDEIVKDKSINYDLEILKFRNNEISNSISKYKVLKESIKDDFQNEYISKDEFLEYDSEYSKALKEFLEEKREVEKKLEQQSSYQTEKNRKWIKKFIKNTNLTVLNKKIIDELVENIYIYNDEKVKITFKYENEFFEVIDFIKKHNYDIIEKAM